MAKNKEYKEKIHKCPECGSTNLIYDRETNETVCGNCGLVISTLEMDRGPEWRAFNEEERAKRSRVGTSISYLIHDKGLSTDISPPNRDAYGNPIKEPYEMWRLRKWQIKSRVSSPQEKSLVQGLNEVSRLSHQLGIPLSLEERAAVLYRKALDKGLIKGRTVVGIASAALYLACRESNIPITLEEIEKVSLANRKDVARCYRLLRHKLELNIPLPRLARYLSKIAEKIGISQETQGLAIRILEEAKKKGEISGKDPMGVSAGALYLACEQNNEKTTQKKIAKTAGVTEVTVRNRYKSLAEKLGIKLPKR